MTALEKAAKEYDEAKAEERRLQLVLSQTRFTLMEAGKQLSGNGDLRQLQDDHTRALSRMLDARDALLKLSSPVR